LYHFPLTSYLNTCCTILESAQDFDSDVFLVAQIRMQRLAIKAYNAFPNPEYDTSMQADFHTSRFMTMGSTRKELDSLKKDLPPELQNHRESVYAWRGSGILHTHHPTGMA
jgi:hypothetical protein